MTAGNYYRCKCGGTFFVDLRAQSYGIYPCVYRYQCDRCGTRRSMPCLAEVEELSKSPVVENAPVKRVFKLRNI